MPRPRLRRHVCIRPNVSYFKPQGIPLRVLKSVELTSEEFEAVWLRDYKGDDQVTAAKHMKTSQSTFQRILTSARRKISAALIDGKAIAIQDISQKKGV